MAIRVALNHKTTYRYDRLVTLQPHVVRLRPAPHCRTPILSYSLRVAAADHFLNWQQDPYSNYLARLVFHKPARELAVEVDLVAEMTAINPFDFFVESVRANTYPFTYDPVLAKELIPYLETAAGRPEAAGPGRRPAPRQGPHTIDYLVEINQRLQQAVTLHHPHGAGRADLRGDADAWAAAPAAIRPGCWCRCCATSAWRPASSPAT